MSYAATNYVIGLFAPDDDDDDAPPGLPGLPASYRLVALLLADRASKKTGEAYVSLRWVGRMANLSRSTVWRAERALADAGVIVVTARRGRVTRVRFPVVDAVAVAAPTCSTCVESPGWITVDPVSHISAPCPDCRPGGAAGAG